MAAAAKRAAAGPLWPTADTVGAGTTAGPAATVTALSRSVVGSNYTSRTAHTRASSLRQAAAITARARARFIYEALVKHLSPALFCHHGGLWSAGGAHVIPDWPQSWWSKRKVN